MDNTPHNESDAPASYFRISTLDSSLVQLLSQNQHYRWVSALLVESEPWTVPWSTRYLRMSTSDSSLV